MPRRIVLLGAPGSGKGTQAARIAGQFDLVNLSTGALIRTEQKSATALGKLADRHLAGGNFLPDDLILEVMNGWLGDHGADGFVLDGFPRTLAQADSFDTMLSAGNARLDAVVLLRVDSEVLRQRVSRRVQCDSCGATHSGVLDEHSAGIACAVPGCDGTLAPRQDDSPETYARRLENYRTLTEPLTDYYRGKGILREIDGEGSSDEVFGAILERIGAPLTLTRE